MRSYTTKLWAASLLLIILYSCDKKKDTEETTIATTEKTSLKSASVPEYSCGVMCDPPTVSYQLPTDACSLEQPAANCFAWSTFLALNWKCSSTRGVADSTATAENYGVPGDFGPTVWESYLSVEEVFTDHGPAAWNTKSLKRGNAYVKKVEMLSKIENTLKKINKRVLKSANSKVQELFQAQGTWLTDQSGNLVWYEVKMNFDEYDFIVKNQLYDPVKQLSFAEQNKGIWTPEGSIELKAAWKVVDADSLEAIKPYYKVSQAMVPAVTGFDKSGQPILGEYTKQYLALVGLHIIRKTPLSPQLFWMTFEHVNNAPIEGQADPNKRYSFYNPKSNAIPNQSPVPGKDSLNTPVQVVRIKQNAPDQGIQDINAYCQNLIKQSNPNSVWQYYELVNVQWPANPVPDNANNGGQYPLQDGAINPKNIANTTMETYAQTDYCMQCHQYGNASTAAGNNTWATDYSFMFSQAVTQKPKNSKAAAKAKK